MKAKSDKKPTVQPEKKRPAPADTAQDGTAASDELDLGTLDQVSGGYTPGGSSTGRTPPPAHHHESP